ncbi:uncharacterized protein LOC113588192 [Electrophorus electricus]|uniref:uncharacterized protein LOC113588192 n=1 Tax=Electrophorus electricus TaxID=8005 RepID=UPI0015D049BE|nr:uncharacterized protein LOC113588192 [Electrophorus electricus]XP_035377675.1 uncharacterized protein LOC113588192 [Electrophorus electricus]
MVRGWTLRSPTNPSWTTRIGTQRWTPQAATTPTWTTMRVTWTLETEGSAATPVCGWTWSPTVEDPPMEVEEVLYEDPPTDSDVQSAISKKDEPPLPKILPKALPRRYRLGASKPFHVAHLEVTLSKEETPFTRTHSPRIHVPVPKPHRGRKEATTVPTPDTGRVAGAPAETGKRKLPPPKSVRGDSPHAGRTSAQPTTGGQPGALAGLLGLLNNPLCNFVPVPVTVSVPIMLSVPVALSPLVSVPVPVSVSIPLSVIVLVPVFPSSVLLALARVGSLGPLSSPFGVGFGASQTSLLLNILCA